MRMSDQDIKLVRVQLAMMGAFVLMFIPFLMSIISALFTPQPLENRAFGVFMSCFLAVLVLLAARYLLFFAVHVKAARLVDSDIVIERLLAFDIHVSRLRNIKTTVLAVPSWKAPYYQRGVLFSSGVSSFFVPDNFPDAIALCDRLTCHSSGTRCARPLI
jgi:hypothetical protein